MSPQNYTIVSALLGASSGESMPTAHITYHRQQWDVQSGYSVRETLVKIGIDPEQVVPLRNKRVLSGQAQVEPGDEIKLVNIIAGG
jgi:sulfur carrier protein ThiS